MFPTPEAREDIHGPGRAPVPGPRDLNPKTKGKPVWRSPLLSAISIQMGSFRTHNPPDFPARLSEGYIFRSLPRGPEAFVDGFPFARLGGGTEDDPLDQSP